MGHLQGCSKVAGCGSEWTTTHEVPDLTAPPQTLLACPCSSGPPRRLPDWGKHLPGLRTLVVAPASTRGSDAPPPPPPPAAHGAPPTLLWLRPSALRSLTSLSLAGSMLGALGPELLALTRLARLDLRACGIGSLPDGLPALRSLTHLDLGDNALRALPEQVCGGDV